MSSALALESFSFEAFEATQPTLAKGVQTLLAPARPKPSYWVQGGAVAVYILALGTATFYSARPAPPVEEKAIELVMLPPVAAPEEQPAPPEIPPPPVAEETPPQPPEPSEPPPPVAEEPAVAPVEPPKPQPKPKPKVVEHKVTPPAQAAVPRSGPTQVPPNAIASGYANQVHARIASAAASLASRAAHQAGRVGYHIVISPSGSVVSQSITASGNAAVDAVATQALARASFPASGMPGNVSLTGAIVFR
jgi:protein TonB